MTMARYPAELVRKRYLFDGSEVTIRPINADDASIEADFVRHLSPESRYSRFMVTLNELPTTTTAPIFLRTTIRITAPRTTVSVATRYCARSVMRTMSSVYSIPKPTKKMVRMY